MLCMNYTWRTVMIAMAGIVISAAICLVVFINQKDIQQIINQVDYYTTVRNKTDFLTDFGGKGMLEI